MTDNINSDQPCNEPSCGVCTRQNSSVITDRQVHIVTYVGDYVVTTVIAPELQDPTVAMLQVLGVTSIPLFTVFVGYVGENSMKGSHDSVPDDQFMRFVERHSNLDNVEGMHEMVVSQVSAGLIDLDTPVDINELEAQSKKYLRDALDRLDNGDIAPFLGGGFDL